MLQLCSEDFRRRARAFAINLVAIYSVARIKCFITIDFELYIYMSAYHQIVHALHNEDVSIIYGWVDRVEKMRLNGVCGICIF